MKDLLKGKVNKVLMSISSIDEEYQNSELIEKNKYSTTECLITKDQTNPEDKHTYLTNFGEIFSEVGFFNEQEKQELSQIVGYQIQNYAIFEQAVTHRSFLSIIEKYALKKEAYEQSSNESLSDIFSQNWKITKSNYKLLKSNERLEFLGDTVLGMVASEFLFFEYTDDLEGSLSKLRSILVREETLIACCEKIKLDKYIKINLSARNAINSGNLAIISDLLEATIAAIYLDAGWDKAKKFVITNILHYAISNLEYKRNCKSELMEYFHSLGRSTPYYTTLEENGPDHQKEFLVGVFVDGEKLGEGTGKTKKIATQVAAENALNLLKQR